MRIVNLTEAKYTDLYPKTFAEFRRKYLKLKNDSSLYVHFSNYKADAIDRTFHDKPDHADPVGLYAYPLKYVIDHPADIWYGRGAKYLHVVRMHPAAKTLYLQHMTQSTMERIIFSMGISRASDIEPTLRGIKRKRRLTGAKAVHQAFMTFVQCNLSDSYECESTRSGKEQSDLFLKAGYTALVDDARSIATAIINDREPNQVCFLRRDAYDPVEMFRLRADDKAAKFLVHGNPDRDPDYLRKIAALCFTAIGDRLADVSKDDPRMFFSKKKRRIHVDIETHIDRTDLKIGQKRHKAHKLSDGTRGNITLYSEKGRFTTWLGNDGTAQEAADYLGTIFANGSNPGADEFVPMDSAEYDAEVKRQKEEASRAYYDAEKKAKIEKNVKAFESAWPEILEVAEFLKVDGIPETVATDKEKNEIVEFFDGMYRATMRNEKIAVGSYVDDMNEKVAQVMKSMADKRDDKTSLAQTEKAYRGMIGFSLDLPMARKMEELYVAAYNYVGTGRFGFYGIYFVSDVKDKMKREASENV